MDIRIINLEQGLPFVAQAIDRLHVAIQNMKSNGEKHAVIIHGYGKMTHGGGKIKEATRKELKEMLSYREISKVAFGEKFSIFDSFGSSLCGKYSNLRQYATGRNIGIVVIELN